MKNLALVLSSIVISASAYASTSSVEYYAHDSSVETSICLVAANKGHTAARLEAKKIGVQHQFYSLVCNGLPVKEFAKTRNVKPQVNAEDKNVVVFPANTSEESQLCVKAVNQGVNAIGTKANRLICNGDSVAHFVKKLKS